MKEIFLAHGESPEHIVPREGLAIRWVEAELQPVALQPGDTLVLMHPGALSPDAIPPIRRAMEQRFPGHAVIVLEEGMRLEVLRAEDPSSPEIS